MSKRNWSSDVCSSYLGWEYIQFIASVFQVSEDTYETKAKELLQEFSLLDRADELIESYSHGMKQKIAICGALINVPDILFLNETTFVIDYKCALTVSYII